MKFSLAYLVYRFFYRIGDFFRHWYLNSSYRFAHFFVALLERFDKTIAIKITLRHFFEPLYGDYTIVGRILGIFFRSGRVLVGILVYALLTAICFAFYLIWLLTPLVLIFIFLVGIF